MLTEEKPWRVSWIDPLFGLPALGVLTVNMTIIALVIVLLYQFETHSAAESQEIKDRMLRNQEAIIALDRELREAVNESRTWNQTEIRNQRTILKHQAEILSMLKKLDNGKQLEPLPPPKMERMP